MNIDDYVQVNRKVLKIVGLYPPNAFKYFLCISCMFLIVVPQIAHIYQERRNFGTVLETSSVLLTIMLAILKSFVWILNRRTIQSFINFMLDDYWKYVAERNIPTPVKKYATYGLTVTKGYLFLICSALLFFFTLPIIEMIVYKINGSTHENKSFPFTAIYPTTFYESPMYEITYVSQMLATSSCALIILGTDTLISTALFHTCGHLKVLQDDLKSLESVGKCYKKITSQETVRNIRLRLTYVIEHHQIILRFCDTMEKIFNPIMFLQTLASSLIICLVGFQVNTTLTKKYKLMQYVSYLLMALFQLLLFSLPGDELIQQSSVVGNAVYSIPWYELSNDVRTLVQTVIIRSQKPSCITAGKFCVVHLENFSAVLSASLSYFMLLRSFSVET